MPSNGPTRSINYKPKMTSLEGYDKCHPKVKKALQGALIPYDGYWCYRKQLERGADWVVKVIQKEDRDRIAKGWKLSTRPGTKSTQTPNRSPLRPNW